MVSVHHHVTHVIDRNRTGSKSRNRNKLAYNLFQNFLLKSSLYNEERERHLMSSMTVTPHSYSQNRPVNHTSIGHATTPTHALPTTFSTGIISISISQKYNMTKVFSLFFNICILNATHSCTYNNLVSSHSLNHF